MGTVSVAELAAALGRPADSLYFHLKVLKKVGLITSQGLRAGRARRETLFRAVAPQFGLRYKTGKQGNRREISAIVGSMLRLGTRDFRRSFLNGDVSVFGGHRELWALRKTGWLTQNQLEEVNGYIARLIKRMATNKRNGRLYGITVLLTPLDDRSRTRIITRHGREARTP
jgi:hypothetical protein